MFERLRHKFPFDDDTWNEFVSYFHRMEVPAKTVLLKDGEVSNKLFAIEKGCVRVWFNHDGKDLTTQFFFENKTVASMESFRKNIPSPVTIETIEPSILWYIHKKNAQKIIDHISEIPALREQFIDAIFERTFDYIKHFISFIRDTPEQRYLNLLNEHPQLIRRVPQHYIASYLGITTVHLSRIKSKLAKKIR